MANTPPPGALATLPPGVTVDQPPPGAVAELPPGVQLDQTPSQTPTLSWGDMIGGLNPFDPAAQQRNLDASTAAVRNSSVGGFVRGVRDPVDAGAQMLARGISAVAPNSQWAQQNLQNTNRAVNNAEADYQQNWRPGNTGTDYGRLAGDILSTGAIGGAVGNLATRALPFINPASFAGRLTSGAIGGAVGSPLSTPDNGIANGADYWTNVGENAALGGGLGAGLTALGGGLARVIKPNTNPDVVTLRNAGVNPTPGQVLGGTANRIEQAATSLPVAGDFIKNARRSAIVDFNRGAINQALAPINQTLETGGAGREALAEMQNKISDNYDKLTSSLGFPTGSAGTASLMNDLGGIYRNATFMPPDTQAQLHNIIKTNILDNLSPEGGMTGEAWQDAKSTLGQLAANYSNSSVASERQLGGALMQTGVALRNALRAANPVAADQLANADNAYAQMLRVQNAGARLGGEPGVFTPSQLVSATRNMDPTLRKRAFAAGDALMQNYAEAGQNVLGNTMPDSGTPYRHAIELGLGVLGGHGIHLPFVTPTAIGYGALAAGTGAAYSPFGRTVMGGLLAGRPGFAGPLAANVRAVTPFAASGVPGLLSGLPAQPTSQ